ncbi:MAG: VTT domain-containing protein [Patescibacteria group bacterium]
MHHVLNRSLLKAAIPLFILALLFLASAYFAQTYDHYFVSLVSNRGLLGLLIYIFIAAFTTVLAPLSSVPLMPLASSIWGPFATAVASIIGWMIGALISFFISRKYGRAFVERFFSREKLSELEKRIPEENLFWSIVLLRMAVPVDLLSYVLGLFKNISWKIYFWATLIGIIPFAFVLAYLARLPWEFQLLGILLIIPILLISRASSRQNKL